MSLRSFIFVALSAALLLGASHPGRTDRYGGHHNRKTGGYHYHNPGYAHDANNPFQDHTKCGICSASKKPDDFQVQPAAPPPEKSKAIYVGSKNSNKYHNPNCVWAKKILARNVVTFSSKEDAVKKGYVPCKVCKP